MKNTNTFTMFVAAAAVVASVGCAGTSARVESGEHRPSAAAASTSAVDGTVGNEHWRKMR